MTDRFSLYNLLHLDKRFHLSYFIKCISGFEENISIITIKSVCLSITVCFKIFTLNFFSGYFFYKIFLLLRIFFLLNFFCGTFLSDFLENLYLA